MPIRIQRSRSKDWRMQDQSPDGRPVVYVGRPTKWGNPFRLTKWGNPFRLDEFKFVFDEDPYFLVTFAYESWLIKTKEGQILSEAAQRELRGKHLCCWCSLDCYCHADVLLRIVNRMP